MADKTNSRSAEPSLPAHDQKQGTTKRVSVFDRLGPMPGQKTTRNNNYNDKIPANYERRAPRSFPPPNHLNQSHQRTMRPDRKPSTLPNHKQQHKEPNKTDAYRPKRNDTPNALSTPQPTAVQLLESKINELERDKTTAEELSNALLLNHQSLLQEKSQLQAETNKLALELKAVKEQLEFFRLQSDSIGVHIDDSLDHNNTNLEQYYTNSTSSPSLEADSIGGDYDGDKDVVITPDTGMLRALAESQRIAVEDLEELDLIRTKLELISKDC